MPRVHEPTVLVGVVWGRNDCVAFGKFFDVSRGRIVTGFRFGLHMKKPLIFISFTASDEDVACRFRDIIAEGFLGQFQTFLSAEDISAGDQWRENVHKQLKACSLLIVIATSRSSHRAWINYEIGAVSVQDKKVIAIIGPDYSHEKLPSTYDTRQAVDGINIKDYNKLIKALTAFLPGTIPPKIDFSDFIAFFRDFEKKAARRNVLIEVLEKSTMVQERLPGWLGQLSKSATMCGLHFQKSLSDHRPIYQAAIRRGVKFAFAVLDPKSKDLQAAATLIGMDTQELKQECISGLTMLKNLRKETNGLPHGDQAEHVDIVLLKKRANARYYIFDEGQADGVIAFTPYTDLRPSQAPTYVYGTSNDAAVQYVESCKSVIERYGEKMV